MLALTILQLSIAVGNEKKAEISINCTGANYTIHYDTGYYYDDYYDNYDDALLVVGINLGLICTDQSCVSCKIAILCFGLSRCQPEPDAQFLCSVSWIWLLEHGFKSFCMM